MGNSRYSKCIDLAIILHRSQPGVSLRYFRVHCLRYQFQFFSEHIVEDLLPPSYGPDVAPECCSASGSACTRFTDSYQIVCPLIRRCSSSRGSAQPLDNAVAPRHVHFGGSVLNPSAHRGDCQVARRTHARYPTVWYRLRAS